MKLIKKIFYILIWILIWEILSIVINQDLILVSPIKVFYRLTTLLLEKNFYISIFTTIFRILIGFIIGLFLSIIFVILSNKYKMIEDLLEPFITTIKSVPVTSFIILLLIYVSSYNLSSVISCLMAFPIFYENIKTGIRHTNKELLEMSKIFNMSKYNIYRYIYFSEVIPYFKSALTISLGLSFKSGIASEIIGLPKNTIGENLYNAKIFFNTTDIFAWTISIIILSFIFQKTLLYLINKLVDTMENSNV